MRKVLIYLLFTLGGVAALTYEVTWMRSFRVVFGSSTQSAAAVLAAYFGGMALGYLIGARLARRGGALGLYGLAELCIGLTALLVGPWLALFQHLYPTLFSWAAGEPALWVTVKLLLALLALAPPTIAMGATLPLVIHAAVPGTQRLARATSLLYALNVVGAMAGAALAGFVLPMSVGVANAVYLAVAMNMLIGLAALGLSLPVRKPAGQIRPAPVLAGARVLDAAPEGQRAGMIVLAAIISGFGTLALEVLYVRILSFYTEGSVYSFSIMLVIFLLCLALGSALVARLGDRSDLWRLLAKTQTAAMLGILLTPYLFDIAASLTLAEGDSLSRQISKFGLLSVATLGLPVIMVGMVLPTTWKLAARDAVEMSHCVGRLVAWNTVAAVAGSLVTAFLLLPWLGLGGSLLFVAVLYGIMAIGGFLRGYRGIGRLLGCAVCIAIPAGWYASGAWQFGAPTLAKGEKLVRYREGAGASVAVIEHANGHRLLRMNHNYSLGSSSDAVRELRQGRLPLILHPHPRRVAFIGVATGITVSAVLDFKVERAVAVELVPEVSDAAAEFSTWNRSVFDDPRVELVVDDGRNYLLGTDERFDVITSDLFIPWHAGTGDLYTVEHFRTARDRLAKGGIFAQWLPGYQLTVDELRSVVASLQEVFPFVTLWRGDFDPERPLVCLVCHNDPVNLDAQALRQAAERLARTSGPGDSFLSSPLGLAMLYVAGDRALRSWSAGAPLNTDDYPYIEYATPGSYYRHKQRDVGAMAGFLAGFRPRQWEYSRPLPDESVQPGLRAADLMHDAQMARQANYFDQEFRCLTELIPLAYEVPAVVDYVIRAAARYRTRNMVQRSDELLLALCNGPQAPLAALVALAEVRRSDGKLQDAIDLLSRAVERVPDARAVRHALLELLKEARQNELIEAHLQYILKGKPDEPYLRLDLAQAFDRQGKAKEAKDQIELFRRLPLGDQRRKAWRYLRTLGLGKYVDEVPAEASQTDPPGGLAKPRDDAGP
ncbi:MAG: fused MFS/spermidine synthase [Pirellulales bacterium]